MESELVSHHHDAPMLLYLVDQFGQAPKIMRDRLLDEQIAARAHAHQRGRDMETGWIADESDRWLLGERVLQSGKDADVVLGLHAATGHQVQAGSHHVRKSPDSIGENVNLAAEDGAQVAHVPLSDSTEANDKDLQHPSLLALECMRPNWWTRNARFWRAHSTSPPSAPRATCKT